MPQRGETGLEIYHTYATTIAGLARNVRGKIRGKVDATAKAR
jgi:hypothetical protein